jgi:hypothetical protein
MFEETNRMSYIPMVKGVGADKWSGNGLRFATAEEALAYAADLQEQWMGCRGGAENRKAEESSDPVSHAWHNGRAIDIKSGVPQRATDKNFKETP